MVYFANLTMLQKFFGVGDVLGVYWTLAVELVFYALCSILVLLGLLSDGRKLEIIFLIITSAGLGAALTRYFTDINIPFAWPMFLSLMLAGAILRKWDRDDRKPGFELVFMVCGYIAVGLVVSVAIYHDPDKYQRAWFQEFGPWAFSILAFLTTHYIYRPRSKSLAFIGATSYSLYLFHGVIGGYLTEKMIDSGFIANQPFLLSLIILLAVMIGFASIIYIVVEKPGIKLGNFLISKFT
jgi:peptidoglycan/LPS O-acetylase OafA/YrhL